MKLSVCMIVKNEENNIIGCLESIQSIADEIIVVDNGSTDSTKNILESYNCIIIDGSGLELDYARSLYLKEARFNWILFIDADERFDYDDTIKLKSLLNEVEEEVWGIQLKNIQYIGHGKWADAYILRVIRNNNLIKYNDSPIHASLTPSIFERGKKIIDCQCRLHHLDILIAGRTTKKRERYRSLLEMELNNPHTSINIDFINLYKCFLALEYIAIEKYESAEMILKETIHKKTRYNHFAISLLCQMYVEVGDYEAISPYLTNENREFLIETEVLGNFLYKKNPLECIELYNKEIVKNPEKYSNYINLAYLLADRDKKRAKLLLLEVIEKNPFMTNSFIYEHGTKPNIFNVQSNILKAIKDVRVLYENLGLGCLISTE